MRYSIFAVEVDFSFSYPPLDGDAFIFDKPARLYLKSNSDVCFFLNFEFFLNEGIKKK